MSEANLETTRRFTEALVRGDYEAAAANLGPNLEIDDTDITESTGADSFYEWLARWDAAWETWRIEALEILPSGEDRTLSLFKMIATGRGSGIELTRDDAVLAEFQDGKIRAVNAPADFEVLVGEVVPPRGSAEREAELKLRGEFHPVSAYPAHDARFHRA